MINQENIWRYWKNYLGWGPYNFADLPKTTTCFYFRRLKLYRFISPIFLWGYFIYNCLDIFNVDTKQLCILFLYINGLSHFYCGARLHYFKSIPELPNKVKVSSVALSLLLVFANNITSKKSHWLFQVWQLLLSSNTGTSSAIFAFIFWQHRVELHGLVSSLEDPSQISINEVLVRVTRFKFEIQESVNFYQNLFTVTTLTGIFSIVLTWTNEGRKGLFSLFINPHFVVFLFNQVLFFYVAGTISQHKKRINDVIRSPHYIHRFLYHKPSYRKRIQDDLDIKILALTHEMSTTVDYLVVYNIIHEPWCEFTVLGIPIHSPDNLQRLGVILVFSMLNFIPK